MAVRAVRVDGLRDIDRVVLEGSWHRHTYQKIAAEAGYTEGYLSRDVGPALWTLLSDALGMQVKKTNFRTAIERWSEQMLAELPAASALDAASNSNGRAAAATLAAAPIPDVASFLPFDISDFRGRQPSLADLADWVINHHGRLLCLSGIPGVGKTWLAVKLAEQVRPHFQQFVYRDLSDRALPSELLGDLLQELGNASDRPDSLAERLDLLTQTLTQRKCLIVLDGIEAVYRPQMLAGTYDARFTDYREILDALASREHPSCVVWVGRDLPRAALPITGSGCRLFCVEGLDQAELSTLAFWPPELTATESDWQLLSHHYGGIPALILAEVAPRIASFGHRLTACLDALQLETQLIQTYIETWLAPLSDVEWQVLTWMMLGQQPLSLQQISQYLNTSMALGAVESLGDRGICHSRVEAGADAVWELALPELLSPYLRDRFLQAFATADEAQQWELLDHYPLLQANAPEMIRQWQRQALLGAVSSLLEATYRRPAEQESFLRRALQASQAPAQRAAAEGYRAGNLVNLAQYWQHSLVDIDFHSLQLRDADLQSDLFQGVSFAGADLQQTLLAKPMGQCPVIAINAHQNEIAVGDQDGRLLLWNRQNGRLQRAMLTVTSAIRAIAFSIDGYTLAEGRQDGTIRLWDLQSEYGPELFANTADEALTTLAFSPDKQLLVGGDEAGNLYVWRLASGEQLHCIAAHSAAVTAIAISPCSQFLLTCGEDCAAVEWQLASGEATQRFQGRLTSRLGTVAYLPGVPPNSLRAVVIGRDEGQLVIWDLTSERPLKVMQEPCDLFMTLTLSPNGRYLAASDISNTVSVWEVDSRARLYQISATSAPVESLVFSPDSRELMTGGDYMVQRWHAYSGQCLRIWRSDRHPAKKLALATHPLRLLSYHDDQTVRCWQHAAERQRWLPQARLQLPDGSLAELMATSQSGHYWAVGTAAGQIAIWDCHRSLWLDWSMRLPKSITALAFDQAGTLLAAGDMTGTVALWDLSNRVFCWQQQQTHTDPVMALAFTPDGQRLYSGSRDRTIQGWDVQGQAIAQLSNHRRRVHTLCVSADGDYLYSGSYDGTVRCWQLSDHTCVNTWQKQDLYIHEIALDEQHRPVVLMSDTQTVELWELDTDTCRATFTPHAEANWHISTSPDGQAIACASQNGDINIWSLATGQKQGQLRVDRPYEGMQIGGSQGLTDSERQMLYSLGATDY
ncbi:MAG: AAA family ATPase [Cyanobacteria bacterium J06626_4]